MNQHDRIGPQLKLARKAGIWCKSPKKPPDEDKDGGQEFDGRSMTFKKAGEGFCPSCFHTPEWYSVTISINLFLLTSNRFSITINHYEIDSPSSFITNTFHISKIAFLLNAECFIWKAGSFHFHLFFPIIQKLLEKKETRMSHISITAR